MVSRLLVLARSGSRRSSVTVFRACEAFHERARSSRFEVHPGDHTHPLTATMPAAIGYYPLAAIVTVNDRPRSFTGGGYPASGWTMREVHSRSLACPCTTMEHHFPWCEPLSARRSVPRGEWTQLSPGRVKEFRSTATNCPPGTTTRCALVTRVWAAPLLRLSSRCVLRAAVSAGRRRA